MIPPVPLILRLAMSAVCIVVSQVSFALAGWISPELDADKRVDDRQFARREPKS